MFGWLTGIFAGLTGYAYVGYPAIVEALAKKRPAEGPYPDATPFVTLVISAFNECDVIGAKLHNTFALDYPPELLHVVVVTDGSVDGTADAARAAAGERAEVLHDPARRGKAAAMARGVARARGAIVVFSDANNLYRPESLREVVRPFTDSTVGAVTGAKVVDGGAADLSSFEATYWKYESRIKAAESRLGCCTAVIGELLAVRRELVPDFPAGLVNDDFFIAMQIARAGYKVAYAPKAVSLEPTATSFTSDAVRRRRMTAGRWQSIAWWRRVLPVRRPLVVWQVASHKYLRLLLPFTMAGALVANALDVATSSPTKRKWPIATLAVQMMFYGLAAGGGTVRRPRALRLVAKGARYLVRSNLASAQGLTWYLGNRSRLHLWDRVSRLDTDMNTVDDAVPTTESRSA